MSVSSQGTASLPFFLSLLRPLMVLCTARVPVSCSSASVLASPRPIIFSLPVSPTNRATEREKIHQSGDREQHLARRAASPPASRPLRPIGR
eukprot:9028293-Pyramimonas_sp.AAC.2